VRAGRSVVCVYEREKEPIDVDVCGWWVGGHCFVYWDWDGGRGREGGGGGGGGWGLGFLVGVL